MSKFFLFEGDLINSDVVSSINLEEEELGILLFFKDGTQRTWVHKSFEDLDKNFEKLSERLL